MPISPYGVSKLASEHYLKVLYKTYGVETVILRYFNVYGPKQKLKNGYAAVIPILISNILKNKRPVIYGDGKQTRDFVFVEDVVDANILAMKSKKAGGESINIASGEKTSLNELIDKINKITGKNIKPLYKKAKKGDIKHSYASVSKARKILNYKPRYSLNKGLKKTIKYFG